MLWGSPMPYSILSASLASTQQLPVDPPLPGVTIQTVFRHCLMSPEHDGGHCGVGRTALPLIENQKYILMNATVEHLVNSHECDSGTCSKYYHALGTLQIPVILTTTL